MINYNYGNILLVLSGNSLMLFKDNKTVQKLVVFSSAVVLATITNQPVVYAQEIPESIIDSVETLNPEIELEILDFRVGETELTGYTSPEHTVSAKIEENTISTISDAEGKFIFEIPPQQENAIITIEVSVETVKVLSSLDYVVMINEVNPKLTEKIPENVEETVEPIENLVMVDPIEPVVEEKVTPEQEVST